MFSTYMIKVNKLFTPLNKFYVTSTIIRIDIKAS